MTTNLKALRFLSRKTIIGTIPNVDNFNLEKVTSIFSTCGRIEKSRLMGKHAIFEYTTEDSACYALNGFTEGKSVLGEIQVAEKTLRFPTPVIPKIPLDIKVFQKCTPEELFRFAMIEFQAGHLQQCSEKIFGSITRAVKDVAIREGEDGAEDWKYHEIQKFIEKFSKRQEINDQSIWTGYRKSFLLHLNFHYGNMIAADIEEIIPLTADTLNKLLCIKEDGFYVD